MHHSIFTGWFQLFLLHTSLPFPSHCFTCSTCRLINYVSTLTTCFGWIVHTEHSSTHPIHLLVSYPNECSPFGRPFSFSSQRLFISILSFASNIFRTINSKHTHLLFGFGWLHFWQRPRPLNSTVNTFNVDFYWCSTFGTNEDTHRHTDIQSHRHTPVYPNDGGWMLYDVVGKLKFISSNRWIYFAFSFCWRAPFHLPSF